MVHTFDQPQRLAIPPTNVRKQLRDPGLLEACFSRTKSQFTFVREEILDGLRSDSLDLSSR